MQHRLRRMAGIELNQTNPFVSGPPGAAESSQRGKPTRGARNLSPLPEGEGQGEGIRNLPQGDRVSHSPVRCRPMELHINEDIMITPLECISRCPDTRSMNASEA